MLILCFFEIFEIFRLEVLSKIKKIEKISKFLRTSAGDPLADLQVSDQNWDLDLVRTPAKTG